jgi:hypothetical protein
LQKLKSFSSKVDRLVSQAGDVASAPAEALDHTRTERIAHRRKNDWYAGRGGFRGPRRECADACDQNIGTQGNEFSGQLR